MNDPSLIQIQVANQYRQSGRFEEAESVCQIILRSDPENSKAHELLGILYLQQKKFDLARRHLTRAADLTPNSPNGHLRLANLHQSLGEFIEAKACFRRVIVLLPETAPRNYMQIAQISRFTSYNEDMRSMESLFEKVDPGSDDRMYLAFALGKSFDDLGDYHKAFGFFAEGNRIARNKYEFSINRINESYQRIIDTFDQNFLRRFSSIGLDDPKPIFITGLPRSGSTLVEQILASHSEVFGAGELGNLHEIAKEVAQTLNMPSPEGFRFAEPDILRSIASRYIVDLTDIANGEPRVTDKSLGSIIYIGLISTILPHAKIIHCKRDLRDLGLSCFQKYFGGQQSYSYELRDIARYAQAREKLVNHWKNLFPGKIFSIRYEDLVTDTENWTHQLLKHCELTYEPACLSFHETKRAVKTVSLEQVRRPVYSSSIGRWKNYSQDLQPLLDELDK